MTGEATYTATYDTPVKRSYTITWKNDDGSVIDTTTVEYGEVPTHADATKAATAEYTYPFKSWSPAVEAVTGEATYTATYDTPVKRKYTITFLDIDGTTELSKKLYDYGTEAANINAPTIIEDGEQKYKITNWDPVLADVEGDKTYKAAAREEAYTITVCPYGEDQPELYSYTIVLVPGEIIPALDKPEQTAEYAEDNMSFLGWEFTAADNPSVASGQPMPAYDEIVYGIWGFEVQAN